MKHPIALPGLLLCVLCLVACSGEPAVYSQESFGADSPFKLKVTSKAGTACESARRALLGQGYLIDEAKDEKVRARKSYKNSDGQNTLIEMNVVCIPERKGSTLFANGLMSTYDLKKSSSSASVGVSAVGSISLPIGQSADSLVKIGEVTIDDAEFYRRFFSAVTYALEEIEPGDEPVGEPRTPPVAPQPEQAIPATAPMPAPVQEALPLPGAPASAQSAPPTIPTGTPAVQPTLQPAAPGLAPSAPSAPVLGTVTTEPQAIPTAGEAVVNPAPAPEAIVAPTTTSEPLQRSPVQQPSVQPEFPPQPDPSSQPLRVPQAQEPVVVPTEPQAPAATAADPSTGPEAPPVTDPAEIFE